MRDFRDMRKLNIVSGNRYNC